MAGTKTVEAVEHSLQWKMDRAYQLTWNLCFVWNEGEGDGSVRDTDELFGKEDSAMLWAWSEGGMHQMYEKVTSGRCSIQRSIDFDVGVFEEEVDEAIARCTELHARIELPLSDECPEEDDELATVETGSASDCVEIGE